MFILNGFCHPNLVGFSKTAVVSKVLGNYLFVRDGERANEFWQYGPTERAQRQRASVDMSDASLALSPSLPPSVVAARAWLKDPLSEDINSAAFVVVVVSF